MPIVPNSNDPPLFTNPTAPSCWQTSRDQASGVLGRFFQRIRVGTVRASTSGAWAPKEGAPVCMQAGCGTRFGLTHHRHHCRVCGAVVCAACSRTRVALPQLSPRPQRVCKGCLSLLVPAGEPVASHGATVTQAPAPVVGLVPVPVGAPPGQGPPQTTPSLAGSESSAGISESASGAGTAVGSDSVVDESESESELGGHGGAAAGVGRSTTATAPLPQALESDAGSSGADPDHASAATSTGSLSISPTGTGSVSGSANANAQLSESRSAFAGEVASSVVTALLSLASRVPLVGPCAGVLQDIFAMHGVSARLCWCQWQWCEASANLNGGHCSAT